MPLDSSIYSQLQPNLAMGMGDIVNKFVDQSQADVERKNRLAQMAQAGELQGLQLQQAKQQAADEAALRQAYKESGGDTAGMVQKLRAQGLHAQADQLIKAQSEQQKANMEMGLKRHEGLATVAGDIANNPTQWQGVIQNSVKAGILHPDDAQTMAQHFASLPQEQIAPEAQKGMVMVKDASAKMAEQLYPKQINPEVKVTDQGYMVRIMPNGTAQPVLDAQGKQVKAQDNNWTVLKTDTGIVQVNPKSGQIRDLGVKAPTGAEKPLTESQTASLAYGTRMLDADKILAEVGQNYSPMKINTAKATEDVPGLNYLANNALNENEQKILQAQRNFVNASLRKESGASISPSEFSNAIKQYFPQPGDDAATIKQKAENRARQINSFKIGSGAGAKHFDEAVPTPSYANQLSPQDQQAIQWAQANKNDPRAVKILQLHGM